MTVSLYLFAMRRLILLLSLFLSFRAGTQPLRFTTLQGALVRGDSAKKELALVFTADEWGEGLPRIRKTLKKEGVKGSFFFTGRFYRNKVFQKEIGKLAKEGHYLGPHS